MLCTRLCLGYKFVSNQGVVFFFSWLCADYEFVPNQDVVNEEISNAIFNWNSRYDEPEGALALHLAGGDMSQLQDIAKRVRLRDNWGNVKRMSNSFDRVFDTLLAGRNM